MEIITTENWTHGQYIKDEMRAIVSCGASPTNTFEYYLTVLDENDAEVFQQTFGQLEDAVEIINLRYHNIWELTDTNAPKGDGGSCSTCVAH